MTSLSIHLGIARSTRSAHAFSGIPKKLEPDQKQAIMERDQHTCQCCGFVSRKYQEILHKNGNPADLRPENLAAVCMFCHQCFHLDQVSEMRSGVFVWLPEIEQTDLHHLARAIYVARISQGPVADAARHGLDIIMSRRNEVTSRLGTDDPNIMSIVMRDYISEKAYQASHKKLEGIRLFPLDRRIIKETDLEFNQFPQILAYWRSKEGPFGGKIPKHWLNIYKELNQKTAA